MNKEVPNLVAHWDLFATLANLTGLEIPRGQAVDSVSFAHHLRPGLGGPERESIAMMGTDFHGNWFSALRWRNYKLVMPTARQQNPTPVADKSKYELYDLSTDMAETRDLSRDPAHQATASQIHRGFMEYLLECDALIYQETGRRGRNLLSSNERTNGTKSVPLVLPSHPGMAQDSS